MMTPLLIIAFLGAMLSGVIDDKVSDKDLMATALKQPNSSTADIIYVDERTFSGQFYSKGQAVEIENPNSIAKLVQQSSPLYLIAEPDEFSALPKAVQERMTLVSSNEKRSLWKKQG